jgi:hypothetical protein
MGPLLKTGRTTGAGYDPVPVAVPIGPRGIRTPANVPQAPRGSIALRMLAAASLLIHAAIIGALIVDFRSSQSKANKPPASAIQVEVVQEPRIPMLLHPIEPIASERPLSSPAASK